MRTHFQNVPVAIRIRHGLVASLLSILLVACTEPQTPTPIAPPTSAVPTVATELVATPPTAPPTSVVPTVISPASTEVADLAELIATITLVEGEVYIQEPVAGRRPAGLMQPVPNSRKATPLTPVRSGSTVQVGANSQATVVYYKGYVQQVPASSSVQVAAGGCSGCATVPTNSTQPTNPGTKCIWINGSCKIQGDTLEGEGDYGNIPIILTPRNTDLITLTPTLEWVSVTGAIEYELSLSHPTPFPIVVIASDALTCVLHPWTEPYSICSAPWPTEWLLVPDKTYYVQVDARIGIFDPLRKSDEVRIHTLSVEQATLLDADIAGVHNLQLDPVTENMLLAGLYATNGVWNATIPAYQRVNAVLENGAAQLQVQLGDAYRAIDLQRFAFLSYAESLRLLDTGLDDPLLRANAEFGQGQVEYNRGIYREAAIHFTRALELYQQVGNTEGLAAATEGLAQAEERIPQN